MAPSTVYPGDREGLPGPEDRETGHDAKAGTRRRPAEGAERRLVRPGLRSLAPPGSSCAQRRLPEPPKTAFPDDGGAVRGGFFGLPAKKRAGVLDDREVRLLASFGGYEVNPTNRALGGRGKDALYNLAS